MKFRSTALLVAVAMVPLAAVVPADAAEPDATSQSPSAKAGLRFHASPAKVVLNQSYENVRWRVGGSDAMWIDSVDVTLEHLRTREVADYDYAYNGNSSGSLKIYDWERPGRYLVYGEAYDDDFNEMSVASTYVTVKYQGRASLSATRAGRTVTLSSKVLRYDGGYPRWAKYRSAKVTFQRKAAHGWKNVGRLRTASNGRATLEVKRTAKARYRVVVAESGRVWSDTSNAVRR